MVVYTSPLFVHFTHFLALVAIYHCTLALQLDCILLQGTLIQYAHLMQRYYLEELYKHCIYCVLHTATSVSSFGVGIM